MKTVKQESQNLGHTGRVSSLVLWLCLLGSQRNSTKIPSHFLSPPKNTSVIGTTLVLLIRNKY